MSGQPSMAHVWERAEEIVKAIDSARKSGGVDKAGADEQLSLRSMFRHHDLLCELLAARGKGPLADSRSVREIGSGSDHRARELATKEMAVAIIMEGGELLDWVQWKSWREPRELPAPVIEATRREVGVELVDLLHFVTNVCMLWGISPEMLAALYYAKNEENQRRAREGY